MHLIIYYLESVANDVTNVSLFADDETETLQIQILVTLQKHSKLRIGAYSRCHVALSSYDNLTTTTTASTYDDNTTKWRLSSTTNMTNRHQSLHAPQQNVHATIQ